MYNKNIDIVLVDDNKRDVELAVQAFKKCEIRNRVYVLQDGKEALDFLLHRGNYEDRPNAKQGRLVLLDLKLPKVDGFGVLAEIKSNPETRATPVIILSASREDRDVVETYRLGVNGYIVKSVDFGKFVEAMRSMGQFWLATNLLPPAA